MRLRSLGRTGMRISELCLGAMTFGAATPIAEARELLSSFEAWGGNAVDTAVNYAGGRSEEVLGQLLGNDRDRFVVSTKYAAPTRAGDANAGGNHAKSLRQALDLSLSRLRTDYVDLLWVHLWDQRTPLEELTRVLDDAVRAGKVLQVGFSNTPAWAVARADAVAEATGRIRPSAIQVEYNLTERTAERELLPMSRSLGLANLAWGPLAGGLLSGKYLAGPAQQGSRLQVSDRRLNERNLTIAATVVEVAAELGVAPAPLALRWLLEQPSRPIPILGARTAAQLREQLACLRVELPRDALVRLDRASEVPLGYPHEFLARIRAAYAS